MKKKTVIRQPDISRIFVIFAMLTRIGHTGFQTVLLIVGMLLITTSTAEAQLVLTKGRISIRDRVVAPEIRPMSQTRQCVALPRRNRWAGSRSQGIRPSVGTTEPGADHPLLERFIFVPWNHLFLQYGGYRPKTRLGNDDHPHSDHPDAVCF